SPTRRSSDLQTTLPNYLSTNIPENRGEQMLSGGLAAYAVYETKDGRWLSVGALEPKFWKVFCHAIERSDFIPLLDAPLQEQYRLKYEIQMIISKKTLSVWLAIFSEIDACVSPVHSFEKMASHTEDRKSTRLNSSHVSISYAVFCLKK